MEKEKNQRCMTGNWPDRRSRWWWRAGVVLALVLVVAQLGLPAASRPAHAQVTTVTVNPTPATVAGCEMIQVEIWVNDVSALYGADFRLSFDPAVLAVVDADAGTTGVQLEPLDTFLSPDWIIRNEADNAAGTLWYAVTQLNPSVGVNGSGPIVRIHLRARSAGASALQFTYSKLANRGGETLPATPVDGSVDSAAPASPALSISRLNSTTARLTWSAVAGTAEYRLYRGTTPYFTPVDPPLYSGTALIHDDAGALGDSSTNYYYVVRAACDNGFESANSDRMGEFDFDLVPSGYNDIAVVLENAAYHDASSLAGYIGSTAQLVSRYNAATQSYQTHIVGVPFTNFALNTGDYLFIVTNGSAPAYTSLVGSVPDAGSVSFALVSGTPSRYNFLSVPLERSDLAYASDIAAEIGSAVALVSRYQIASQSYQTYIPGVPFTDFPLQIGEPFALTLGAGAPAVWP